MRILLLSLLLTFAPIAAGQGATGNPDEPMAQTDGTGSPTEQETVEEGPGIAYGTAVLVGIAVFAGALAWAAWRYARRPPTV